MKKSNEKIAKKLKKIESASHVPECNCHFFIGRENKQNLSKQKWKPASIQIPQNFMEMKKQNENKGKNFGEFRNLIFPHLI